jgi:polar amino acid transport system permease protein
VATASKEPHAIGTDRFEVAPTRHIGRWAAATVVVLIGVAVVVSMTTNPRFEWRVVGHYFAAPVILEGLGRTLALTAIAMGIGIALGAILALMRLSSNPVMYGASSIYTWFFRGIPPLVLLIFVYNISALYPSFGVRIPFGGPLIFSANANALITPFTAAIIGLGLNESAFMGEIIRAGIHSVPPGQTEAALSVGMSRLQVMRRIVLPQAMRLIIPPTGNETIGMLKMTSLVSVLALSDLLYSAQLIYSATFQTIPLLTVATLWYLIATTILTVAQRYAELHFSHSTGTRGQPTLREQVRRNVLRRRGHSGQ